MPFGVPLPSTLPQVPRKDGYQTTARPNTVVFETEVGPGKVRRRGTARTKPLACVFTYTREQVEIFEAFFEDDLFDGTVRMTWTDPLRGDAADWLFDRSAPYMASAQPNSLFWDMAWRLERLP